MFEESKKLHHFRSNFRQQLTEINDLKQKLLLSKDKFNTLEKENIRLEKINRQLNETIDGLSRQLLFLQQEREHEKEQSYLRQEKEKEQSSLQQVLAEIEVSLPSPEIEVLQTPKVTEVPQVENTFTEVSLLQTETQSETQSESLAESHLEAPVVPTVSTSSGWFSWWST